MTRKNFLLFIAFNVWAMNSYSQSDGYIDKAVPPFDNETYELDWSKVEYKPIIRYNGNKQIQQTNVHNKNGSNAILTVSDNTDVQVFPSAVAQSEQHMTVSKINPLNIILCSNTPNYEGYYVSQDGGTTWFGSNSMPDNVQSYGDPSTAVDASGNVFIEAMQPSGGGAAGYRTFKSINQGTSWGTPVAQNFGNINFDKQMMSIDNLPGSPHLNKIYTAWTDFTGSYAVKFNRSVDNGVTYSVPITLRTGWGQGTNVQTGVNGEVFVCWAQYTGSAYPASGLGFSRSTDGGATFTDLTPVFPYVGIRTSGSNPIFNNTRVNDFPSMAVDKSCGPNHGRIYAAIPQKLGGTGKAIISVRYSDDNGTSWSSGIEVSISAGRQNWFPWITVDDATGTVSVAYLSLDQVTGFTTNTYLAYSFDGAATWNNIKVSDVGHTVAAIPGFATGYCGDYIANTAYGNRNYISWNDNRNGQWQNYVSRIDFSATAIYSNASNINIAGPVSHILPWSADLHYNTSGNISGPTTSTLEIQSGANVEMLAGISVTLTAGFHAKDGSTFKAATGAVSCANTFARDEVAQQINERSKLLKPAYKDDATVQFEFYPNPASSEINFEYLLTDKSDVSIVLLDMQGKEIAVLLNNITQLPGLSKLSYNVSSLSNGLYTYKLVTNTYSKIGRFVKAN
ncbi:MAG: T9SS type A sorting domain-containing protein [Bacteroidia bacterium]